MKGWKTITFNVVTGVLALAGDFSDLPFMTPSILLYINVIGNGILRFMTNSPVFNSSIPGEGPKG